MKIVMFTDSYKPQINGVTTSIDLFVEDLRSKGHEVHVFFPKDRRVPKTKYLHPIASFKFIPYPEYKIGVPSLHMKTLRTVRKIRPDVIHLQSPVAIGSLGLMVAKTLRIPIVATYHTHLTEYASYIGSSRSLQKLTKKFIKWYVKGFYNKCDAVMAPSVEIKHVLQKWGIRKPIAVMPTGIKLSAKIAKKKTNLVLHVGRICREKSIDVAVKEFGAASKKISAKMVITSDGPDRKRIEHTIEKLGLSQKIRMTGYVSEQELKELFRRASVLVSASKTETQGLVILEAFANGCPVIVSDSLGFKDSVRNGYNGYLCKKDPEISANLIKVLGNERLWKTLSDNAYIKTLGDKLISIYKSVL
jgi:1,2-diacylglycerol 3-alpha-glucosyltransferase